jgi:hypothetical protein
MLEFSARVAQTRANDGGSGTISGTAAACSTHQRPVGVVAPDGLSRRNTDHLIGAIIYWICSGDVKVAAVATMFRHLLQ